MVESLPSKYKTMSSNPSIAKKKKRKKKKEKELRCVLCSNTSICQNYFISFPSEVIDNLPEQKHSIYPSVDKKDVSPGLTCCDSEKTILPKCDSVSLCHM
jgi:hypothetical protein